MEERPKADEEYLTAAQLRQRISQPVPYCFGAEYSKLSAIARIAAAVSDGEALTEEAGRQLGREVQWLLVDRGAVVCTDPHSVLSVPVSLAEQCSDASVPKRA